MPAFPIMRPLIDLDNREFWNAVKKHEMVLQRCRECGTFYHIPRPMCPKCREFAMEWVPSNGKGKVYTWATVVYERTAMPGFSVPYVIVLVELEEGVRLISNMVDCDPKELYIGMPVEVVFDDIKDVAGELTLYKFRPTGTKQTS